MVCSNIRKKRVSNMSTRRQVGVALIEYIEFNNRLQWHGHVQQRLDMSQQERFEFI